MQANPKYFTRTETDSILKATDNPQDHLFVNLLWQTGARISELLDICPENISVYARTITFKTLKRSGNLLRVIPLHPGILKETLFYIKKKGLAANEHLFPITRDAVNKMVIRTVLKAGLDRDRAHPHTFRHSFAVNCLLQDVPLALTALKSVLGHSNISSTMIYSNITGADIQRCFDGLRF